MHLLFLSATFADADHPAQGSYNVALCRALALEHRVTAVSPRGWSSVMRNMLRRQKFQPSPACSAARIDCHYPTYWYTPGFRHARHGAAMWRSVKRTVRRIHEAQPIDAVLSYWAHPDGEAGLRAARHAGVPHAVIVGGSDVLLLPQQPDRRDAVRRVLCESDAVITVSDGLREAVIAQGVEPGRVHTIYQGVDVDQYHPGDRQAARQRLGLPAERAILLWVGRMVEVKRLDVLIAACAKLSGTSLDFELCLAGDGPLRPDIERAIGDAGLSERVRFLGSVRHEQLPDWYRAADATVLSSRSEGLPNVLRESLACGTPFASTDVGSIAEIADPAWSRLAPANDASALAEAIAAVLQPDFRDAAAKYRARTWSACAADVVRLFDQLCDARTERQPQRPHSDSSRQKTGPSVQLASLESAH
ncbi:MAG: glycosyltransferase [Planctomycetaceae bacterium]|nr:glycosyltransferase [Planctomycetaceae bacterium]